MRSRLYQAIALLVLLVACSSDNGTAPDDGNGGGNGGGDGTVTRADTVWVQDMEIFAARMDQWAGESPDTVAARALAYLQSLPTVKNAGVFPGSSTVWATFSNGFDLIIPNNREASAAEDTLVDAVATPAARGSSTARRITVPAGRRAVEAMSVPQTALEIPASERFRAVNAIGTCHVNSLPVIRSLLTKSSYVDANPPLPTVAGLMNVQGDGVFYINSHGGPGYDAKAVPYYAVWTLDPIDVATLANYRGMVARHELVGMLETSNDALGNCTKVMHYGITSRFVQKYMHFEPNSLVIVDACWSASGPAGAMRTAFRDAGASVFLGWSGSVSDRFAYAAMKYLLDRLAGINTISPENPKQRAFNIDAVHTDMANNRNLVVDPFANAALTVFKLRDDFGLLSPSIQFLSIEGGASVDRLYIAGIFGTDPGPGKRSVTINGQAPGNVEWEPTLITCDLPDDLAGEVVVAIGEGGNKRSSNPVNLTEWKGQLTYERIGAGNLRADMTMNIHFRADIHSFREEPHETPYETTVLFNFMRDTSLSITTGGSVTNVLGECSDTFTLSRGMELRSPYEASQEGGWAYLGSVDTQAHVLQLNLHIVTLFEAGTWVHSGIPECAPFTSPLYVAILPEECLFDDLQGLKAFRMQMGADFEVLADNRGPCTSPPLVVPLQDPGQASFHWGAMTPSYLPDPDAPR